MKLKMSAIALLAMIVPAQARAATLTDSEAAFLDQLVTAAAVLEQRCTGYEADGAGGVQLGARLLGSPNAAMVELTPKPVQGRFESSAVATSREPAKPVKSAEAMNRTGGVRAAITPPGQE